ncbi:MAG: magnesium-translocating P-type ATPase [Candidatus Micrarchaeota archaeon]|nr:magnesium-translocating P-type ATPase [Candidatus Micrarchaeota archaeon]
MPNNSEMFDDWSKPVDTLVKGLGSDKNGLNEEEVGKRLQKYGPNELAVKKKRNIVLRYLSYFVNPLIVFLIIIGVLSYYLSSAISGELIFAMVMISVSLTFYEEYNAQDAADKLRKMIRNTATVVREGKEKEVPLKSLVPGDIVRLSAGDLVPADCAIISCKDFFVNQASLTGESLPVEKTNEASKKGSGITDLGNAVFFGSSVVSGSATALVLRTGLNTQFGELSTRLTQAAPETAFDRGIKDYSMLMLKFIFALVVVLFVINAVFKTADSMEARFINAFLFSLAVAVGLTPEMLPVIVTANLSQGAKKMAKKDVIVKRLSSIQNLGAMDVLCTDKTGTLTEDRIALVRHINADGEEDEVTLQLAYLNSLHQTGLKNPLDKAIMDHDAENGAKEAAEYEKLDEIPFDFSRRRMSVVVMEKGKAAKKNAVALLLTKGAPEGVLPLCTHHSTHGIQHPFDADDLKGANEIYRKLSSEGYRVLALASRKMKDHRASYSVADEKDLTFEGFLAFLDPPKESARESLAELMKRGIEVKILSGDNELVNMKIAADVGLPVKGIITGEELEKVSDEALKVLVENNTVFARVLPAQKERIILALQRNKHVVGFMGDGINDSLALRTADVGISVDTAVDVAKESADIILLRKSLHVLYEGVDEGRRTFANTMKYLRMGSSSNFGNMFSVLGASIFLPFLPMKPIQLLFNNFLYDFANISVPSDNVDNEALKKPAKWDLENVKNFMLYIGPLSSIFDYLTYFTLYFVLAVPEGVFQAGWFIESIMTQTLIIYVIRTNRVPFIESMPSKQLIITSTAILLIALFVVLGPVGQYFGFAALPAIFWPILVVFIAAYLVLTYFVKKWLLDKKMIN